MSNFLQGTIARETGQLIPLALAALVASLLAAGGNAEAEDVVPSSGIRWNDVRAGNPLVPGYFADPCIRKFGDTYYLYATPDGWGVGAGPFVIWTSEDFVHWTAHPSNWPSTNEKWAPSVVGHNGTYTMYSQVPCKIYVATAATPLGPWTNPLPGGAALIPDQTPPGTITLDGEAFIDDDGQAYLYYGTWWRPTVVKLNPDMISTLPGSAVQYFGDKTPYGTVKNCMEAPYMFKRNGVYYYMYSNGSCHDETYAVEYSTGPSPLGPWTYGAHNPILSTSVDGTVHGPGHHSILEDDDKVYIVYHRHDNPHSPGGVHRQIAADKLVFNPDGSIAKVVPTHSGIGYLAPSTKRDTNLAVGRSAKASSDAGPDWRADNAADENNSTLWKAADYTYPQWLIVDIGSTKSFQRCEIDFQFPQVAYRYVIEYSDDGTSWSRFADRRENIAMGGPMLDAVDVPVHGRYVRITILGDDMPQRPNPEVGVWNLKVYDGVDRPDPTPVVSAGEDQGGTMAFPALRLSGSLLYATGPVTYAWSKLDGPGTVSFSDAGRLDPHVTFSVAGKYVLQLVASDGARTGSDTVTCTLGPAGDTLVAYPMDEPGGVYLTDISGNHQDGILVKDPVRGTGAVNNCLSFDGTGSFVHVPPLPACAAWTLSAWVKPDTLVDHGSIFSTNGAAEGAWDVSVRGDGRLHVMMAGSSPSDTVSEFAFTPDTIGTWTYIALVYSADVRRIDFYVNGVLDSARPLETAGETIATTGARIGGWDGGGRAFVGKIDELILFNRALTAVEVSQLRGTVSFPGVRDALNLADGESVTLKAVPVTYAPVDNRLARATSAFYVQDPDGRRGLRVENGAVGQDAAVADGGVTLSGIMRTRATSGERYLECTSLPELDSAPRVMPRPITLSTADADELKGTLVTLSDATIVSIARDKKSMVIADSTAQIEVVCEYGAIDENLAAGNRAAVSGILVHTAQSGPIVLLKSCWRTDPPVDMMTYKLQAYFPFDESAGTTASDASGRQRAIALFHPAWGPGQVGNSLKLDGKATGGTIPDLGLFPCVTIAGWMDLATLSDWQAVVHCDGWDLNDLHLSFRGGGLFFSVHGNEPVDVGSPPVFTTANLRTWQWIAVVYDSGAKTVVFYANGKPIGTARYTTAVAANLAQGIHLGCWNGGDRFFGGGMDELRFYGRALDGAEIDALYRSSSGPVGVKVDRRVE